MTRPPLSLLICALSFALAACTVDRAAPAETAAAPASSAPQPAADVPSNPMPPSSTSPVSTPPDGAASDARFDGYGDMRFGMTAAEATTAWSGELTRLGTAGEPCYYLTPKWVRNSAEFAFMVEDDRFVRYSTESAKFTAPGGGKVGMTTAQIEAMYPGRIERMPHKYTDGQYLRIKDSDDAKRAVLFETDAAGVVTEWRAGVAPQVDYVEGCS